MGHSEQQPFRPATVAILTVSDSRTRATDTSGRFIYEALENAGHHICAHTIVSDDIPAIRKQLDAFLKPPVCEFIILTGGTGLSKRDITPEAIQPYITKDIPGFGELFRMLSYEEIGTSTIQSRATAGLADGVVLFALPGSTGACRLAMTKIILPQIDNTHRPCNFRNIVTATPG